MMVRHASPLHRGQRKRLFRCWNWRPQRCAGGRRRSALVCAEQRNDDVRPRVSKNPTATAAASLENFHLCRLSVENEPRGWKQAQFPLDTDAVRRHGGHLRKKLARKTVHYRNVREVSLVFLPRFLRPTATQMMSGFKKSEKRPESIPQCQNFRVRFRSLFLQCIAYVECTGIKNE